MPVKHLISPGIGFSPGSVMFIVTRGLIGIVPFGISLDFDLTIQENTSSDLTVQEDIISSLTIQEDISSDLSI